MNFGQALEALKEGKLVQRSGWNGKGMFIFIRPQDVIEVTSIQNIKSLPEPVKKYFLNRTDIDTGVKFTAYLCMKTSDNSIVNGWLASQTDMLSEDWEIFEN